MKRVLTIALIGAITILSGSILSGCKKETVIRVQEPEAWMNPFYQGLTYPDTAVKRMNDYTNPQRFVAIPKGGKLFFLSTDEWLTTLPMDYRRQKLDSLAFDFYRQVFGDKQHPNQLAYLCLFSIVFRIEFSESGTDNADYIVEFPYYYSDSLFDSIRPF
jgi:hypothetical protein